MTNIEKQRQFGRNHYQNNKQYYLDRNNAVREEKRQYLRKLRESPCTDCGNTYPWYVMEFDHVTKKEFNIGVAINKGWAKLREELAKCEVVCANCHKVRTHLRRTESSS